MAAGETEAASGAHRAPAQPHPDLIRDDPVGWASAHAGGTDPRVGALRVAIERLRRDLNGYSAALADRGSAEHHLALLSAAASDPAPEAVALRNALLMIAGAVGSVSALAPAVVQLRQAVELFGPPHGVGQDFPTGVSYGPYGGALPRPVDWPAGH
ncbi:DUF5955 family protein [Streptomyces sp. 8K308]|uniref:DUF5955 family protein n=1 Tax=Streptomyces sp. 8K308 TaxID=2530388 RepID=UPI0026B67D59